MDEKELFGNVVRYVIDNVLTFEEYHSMGVENFHNWVREHYAPVPKSELVVGQEYPGECRNAGKATWDGKVFRYQRYKWGETFEDKINHYEDDNGFDVFVPVKQIKEF